MPISSWLCTKSTKNMLVKIVHPGGHVELHDCTVLAAELMHRNPRCCVAYPHIFKQPWAIVPPDAMLQLGQKYYVVPIRTVRKLQRHSLKYSPATSPQEREDQITSPCKEEESVNQEMVKICWFFMNKNSPKYACLAHSGSGDQKQEEKGCLQSNNCFVCLLTGSKNNGEGAKVDAKSLPSTSGSPSSSETKRASRKRVGRDFTKNGVKGTPKRVLDNWHPSLHSITEEQLDTL